MVNPIRRSVVPTLCSHDLNEYQSSHPSDASTSSLFQGLATFSSFLHFRSPSYLAYLPQVLFTSSHFFGMEQSVCQASPSPISVLVGKIKGIRTTPWLYPKEGHKDIHVSTRNLLPEASCSTAGTTEPKCPWGRVLRCFFKPSAP